MKDIIKEEFNNNKHIVMYGDKDNLNFSHVYEILDRQQPFELGEIDRTDLKDSIDTDNSALRMKDEDLVAIDFGIDETGNICITFDSDKRNCSKIEKVIDVIQNLDIGTTVSNSSPTDISAQNITIATDSSPYGDTFARKDIFDHCINIMRYYWSRVGISSNETTWDVKVNVETYPSTGWYLDNIYCEMKAYDGEERTGNYYPTANCSGSSVTLSSPVTRSGDIGGSLSYSHDCGDSNQVKTYVGLIGTDINSKTWKYNFVDRDNATSGHVMDFGTQYKNNSGTLHLYSDVMIYICDSFSYGTKVVDGETVEDRSVVIKGGGQHTGQFHDFVIKDLKY